jgi:hypothetical protein
LLILVSPETAEKLEKAENNFGNFFGGSSYQKI